MMGDSDDLNIRRLVWRYRETVMLFCTSEESSHVFVGFDGESLVRLCAFEDAVPSLTNVYGEDGVQTLLDEAAQAKKFCEDLEDEDFACVVTYVWTDFSKAAPGTGPDEEVCLAQTGTMSLSLTDNAVAPKGEAVDEADEPNAWQRGVAFGARPSGETTLN